MGEGKWWVGDVVLHLVHALLSAHPVVNACGPGR